MGVAALLAVVGIVLAVNASSLPSVQAPADPIGTRPVPFIVAGLLLTCAEVEGGEDVDLSHPPTGRPSVCSCSPSSRTSC